MSRYIDADALYIELKRFYGLHLSDVLKIVENFPTANVQEVKHGKWIDAGMYRGLVYRQCNQCNKVTEDYVIEECEGAYRIVDPYYCGYCGARMDGDSV